MRGGTAQKDLKAVGKAELHQNDCPDGNHVVQQQNSALRVNCGNDAGFAGKLHEGATVDYVEAIENVAMNRNNDGQQCENTSLKLVSWHNYFSLDDKKHTLITMHKSKYAVYRNQIYIPYEVKRVSFVNIKFYLSKFTRALLLL